MSKKCAFQYDDGRDCRCWAQRGSNFCNNHQPETRWHETDEHLHPLARLATPEDLFDVIRETLNATRHGRIPPGQAYAVGYLAQLWLQVHKELSYHYEKEELYNQVIPTLVDSSAAEHEERKSRPMPAPLPPLVPPIDPEAPSGHIPVTEQAMAETRARMGPLQLHTPEQRADLHRHLAEIEARSKAALAADAAAASRNAVYPEAAAGGRRADAAAVGAPLVYPEAAAGDRRAAPSSSLDPSDLREALDALTADDSPDSEPAPLKPRTTRADLRANAQHLSPFLRAAVKKIIRDSGSPRDRDTRSTGGIFPAPPKSATPHTKPRSKSASAGSSP
jgi:hypothetical protein